MILKEYSSAIGLYSFDDEYSEDYIKISSKDFEVERLSEGMSPFSMIYGQPMLYVNYPTFKIQIYDGCDIELLKYG